MPRGGVRAAKFRFFHLAPASALAEDPVLERRCKNGRKVGYTAVKNRSRKFFYNPSEPNLRQQRADGTWIANLLKEVSAMIPVGLFTVRQADYADLGRIEELDRLFGNAALTRDYFEAWLRHHPEGFLVAEYDGRVYGYSMVIYLHGRQIRENWYHDTGGGTCSTHTPLGEYLYAVSIASQKQEAARALFIASRRTFIRSHVYQTVIFGRLPRFRKWVESQGYAPELLDKATKRRLLDIYVNTWYGSCRVFT